MAEVLVLGSIFSIRKYNRQLAKARIGTRAIIMKIEKIFPFVFHSFVIPARFIMIRSIRLKDIMIKDKIIPLSLNKVSENKIGNSNNFSVGFLSEMKEIARAAPKVIPMTLST